MIQKKDVENQMKPTLPINFYGSKKSIAKWIISKFPVFYKDLHYVEPFAGGLAILLNKKKSYLESINDIDVHLWNFWKVFTDPNDFLKFKDKIKYLLYSEKEYNNAKNFLRNNKYDPNKKIEFAVNYFININMSFSAGLITGFAFNKDINHEQPRIFFNKFIWLNYFHKRMQKVQIFNRDAISLIKTLDARTTLFYLDPPYPETCQNQYKGYTNKDFNDLINTLKSIKGNFLLSCYEKEFMKFDPSWNKYYKKLIITNNASKTKLKDKTRKELLVTNYK